MTESWIKAALIRAVKTGAQAAIAVLGVAAALSEVEWDELGGVVGLSMLLSVLMSLAGLPEAEPSPLQKLTAGEEGQVTWPILLIGVVAAFLLGALCYANGIVVGD